MEVILYFLEVFGFYVVFGWMVVGILNILYDGEICRLVEWGIVSFDGFCVLKEDCEVFGKGEVGLGWWWLLFKCGL